MMIHVTPNPKLHFPLVRWRAGPKPQPSWVAELLTSSPAWLVARAALAFVAILCASATAEPLRGRVVHIRDGDTVEIVDSANRTIPIRLGGIDAPEHTQPFGAKAKEFMADLVSGKDVVVDAYKRDRNERSVGTLFLDGNDVGLKMVESGLAWWYRQFSAEQSLPDRALYEAAENDARSQRRGLWVDPNPMPPWVYRHQPPPREGYANQCLCGSDATCTGPKGGHFCVTGSGAKRYVKTDHQ